MVVIADDITGAAEIAGIALSAGLSTKLSTKFVPINGEDCLVIATDCRQMSENEAIEECKKMAIYRDETIFKKCDSVLRGHILAENNAVISVTNYKDLLLVPQNPSRGRVVRNGVYYINNAPLHQTNFAFDPEFPATTSNVSSLNVKDAETMEDIQKLAKEAENETLFVGGADLFRCFLGEKGITTTTHTEGKLKKNIEERLIIVCGSTLSTYIAESPYCKNNQCIECNMPKNVYLGQESIDKWQESLHKTFLHNNLILTINHPVVKEKAFATRLRKSVSAVVKSLVSSSNQQILLIIEGGATAFQILKDLDITEFTVTNEYSTGIVELSCNNLRLILKPGSYHWQGLL